MRISYEWLASMVDVPTDPAELVQEFVRTGTEVEAVERVGADLQNVVTAQVVSKKPHPDSDHMWVCEVSVGKRNVDEDGNPKPLQIVCGAQNFNEGDHIVCAMIGAVLPGDFRIKRSKLRGVESCGMNCSSRELGLGSDHEGIMILPQDAPLGMDITEYLGMSDTVIDCEITPNRPDCLSMVGMAREVSAMLDVDMHAELPQLTAEKGDAAADLVEVCIDDATLCSRYTARVLRNVVIGPSPEWLARRITALGGRPINNVVDITNYVMYLTGQPLHAFDLGKLSEREGKRHVVVRGARAGERLTTLDGQERELAAGMALITDDEATPIALAGVMGGLETEVTDATTDILLESAAFAPGSISHTSRDLDLMSEASIRYERRVDAEGCARAAEVACALFAELAGAEVCPGIVDVYPGKEEAAVVSLRPERVRAVCGAPIENDFMEQRLVRLGCSVNRADGATWAVTCPTWRPDLTREADLIEEVLRLWGEGEVPPTIPAARNHAGGLTVEQRRQRNIGAVLRACGLSETTTYCFAAPDELSRLRITEVGRGIPVRIENPLVSEQCEMRRSLLPGLVRSVAYNLDHGVANVALYEMGRVFWGKEGRPQPDEPTFVAGVLAGHKAEDAWCEHFAEVDFFDAKGVVEELLSALNITKVRFRVVDETTHPWLQPGRAAEVLAQGEVVGWVGNLHPAALHAADIEVAVVAFEFSQAALLRLAADRLPYCDVPTLPGVTQDLAIVVDESVTYEQLAQRISSAGGKLLADLHLFDVYRDEDRVGAGRKSMAFSLTYRAADRTLTSEEVERAHQRLVEKVCRSTGGEVRS